MITRPVAPKLRFVGGFSDKDAFDAQGAGYLSHVMVEFGDGRLYPVFFYDIVRLQQDLEENVKLGRPFIADPGMIVVEEVTPEAMKHAVEQLSREGFFDHLTAITEDEMASEDPYRWPPQLPQKGATRKAKRRAKGTTGKAMGTR
jgi:hypothetical protein